MKLFLNICLALFISLGLSGCLGSSDEREPEKWDPGSWSIAGAPLDKPWINCVSATEARLFVGTNTTFYASEGDKFILPLGADVGVVHDIFESSGEVVVDGPMQLSMDGGAAWSKFKIPPPFGPDSELIGTVFKVAPAGPNLFAYAADGNFVSNDRGETWIHAALTDTPLVVAAQGGARVVCSLHGCSVSSDGGATLRQSNLTPMAIAYSLYTLGDFWFITGGINNETFLVSNDAGSTWSAGAPSTPRQFYKIESLALTPAGRLFAVGDDYFLYTSADHGKTWLFVKIPPPPNGDFLAVKSAVYWKDALWVGTDQGLWHFQVQ